MSCRSAGILILVQIISLGGTGAWAAGGDALKDNGDGTATDAKTGLMWQTAKSQDMSWPAAGRFCRALSLAGHSDWTLPTKDQLVSSYDDGGFRNTGVYWASDEAPNFAYFRLVYVVDSKDGSASGGPSTESGQVESHDNVVNNANLGTLLWSARCVRPTK